MIFKKQPASTEILLEHPLQVSEEFVEKQLDTLASDDYPWWSRSNYVLRTKRHAVAWVRNYVVTECSELNDNFVSSEKSYEVVVSRQGSRLLKFAFRLSTAGLEGYTEYSISLKKMGDYYACIE